MALDGIVISRLIKELNLAVKTKKVNKILQHNNDNIILNFKDSNLLISCNATYPRIYLSESDYNSDIKQSNFTLNLRKYLTGAIVTDITQVGLDRIIDIAFIALNDFKEKVTLHLIIEIMGKYSNVILTNDDEDIIDSFVHVTSFISSKRTILPKSKYTRLAEAEKFDIIEISSDESDNGKDNYIENVISKLMDFKKSCDDSMSSISFLSSYFYGISKPVAESYLINHFSKDDKIDIKDLSNITKELLRDFISYVKITALGDENDCRIYYSKQTPADFHVISLDALAHDTSVSYDSVSTMMEHFYDKKARANNIKSQSTDIKIILNNAMSKAIKKKAIHTKNIEDSKSSDVFKVYGDLIFSNIYQIKKGDKVAKLINFYDDNKEVEIKLDENLTPSENANRYYKKFNKQKSTLKNSISQLKEIDEEIVYLETVSNYLDIALTFEDIESIRQELIEGGYLKKRLFASNNKKKKKVEVSKPAKYISSDGFEIYIGKNNIQNDEITFKIGKDSDVWMHVQDIPGSHVIIKTNGKGLSSVPERTLYEAANLGVFFSKGRDFAKVPIDYTERKFVRKPSGAKPGFVIFLNNKTLLIAPDKEVLNYFNISLI